ncbi:hypothetical protein AVEN_217933-1, partial [Araneus ventricosus]
TIPGAGTDVNRWEQDLDYKRDGQTPCSGTVAAVVVCAAPHEGVKQSPGDYHLFEHLK